MQRTIAVIAGSVLVGAVCFLGSPHVADALHRVTPLVLQVTTNPSQDVGGPAFSIGQNVMVFHSDGDLLSNGNTVPQIFLFEMSARVTGKNRPGLYQLTSDLLQGSFEPVAATRGKVLAFHSTADHLGNGSLGRQIFASRKVRWRKGQAPWLQVTKNLGESFGAVISQTGRYIAFSSTGNLTNEPLQPGQHLYRVELRRLEKTAASCHGYPCLGNPGLKLVTPVEAFNPAIDPQGERIVFESRGDAAGNGCVNGALQLFMKDFQTGQIYQLTFGLGDSRNARFILDGSKIYFESAADLALRGNSSPNVFSLSLDGLQANGTPLPAQYRQITFGTDGESIEPSPSGVTGRLVFFKSTASVTGAPAGVQRLYLAETDFEPPRLTRLTDGQNLLSRLTSQFTFVAFASDGNFDGNSNNQRHLFLLNIFPLLEQPAQPPTPTPTVSPTATATPIPGEPKNIGMALVVNEAADNGDNTLTTLIAATVGDFFGNPVPTGTSVNFSVIPETAGVLVSNGTTNTDPDCDVSRFEAKTGVNVINRAGVVHVCVTYPGGLAGSTHTIKAVSGPTKCVGGSAAGALCMDDSQCPPIGLCSVSVQTVCTGEQDCPLIETCVQHEASCQATAMAVGEFRLPLPHNDCNVNAQPCSDFNPCTDNDVCGGGLPDRACVGGTRDGLVCTSDAQCPESRRCFGGSNHGGACASQFDCPPLASGGDPGECRLETTGACQLTTPPTCQPGTPRACADDGNLCTTDVCNFFNGACGVPLHCPYDGNPCTDDVCDPATGLCYIPNSAPCDQINPCLDDTCDGTTGTCGVPNTDPCEDGDLCTVGDVCSLGTCVPGLPTVCPIDGNPCTNDVCNPVDGTCGIPQACACP